jgi:pilus assembly protein Flp/PilA
VRKSFLARFSTWQSVKGFQMQRFRVAVGRLLCEEDAPTSVEYAIMVGLIAVAVIGGSTLLGVNVNAHFQAFAAVFAGLAAGIGGG